MAENSRESRCEEAKKSKEPCPCEKKCICKGDKCSYNNKNCCYLQPKDVSIVQVYDPSLFQIINTLDNLYLTAIPLEINTSDYKIESSSIQRPNDTLSINQFGMYSIYASFKYSFKFNKNAVAGDLIRIEFILKGNDDELLTIVDSITVPKITDDESKEVINTVQCRKLQIVDYNDILKINIELNNFDFDKVVLNEIMISDLVLIVEKII